MKNIVRIAVLCCLPLVLAPLAIRAQDQSAAPAATQDIQIFNTPADQQPSDAQLKKLFDTMRLHEQMAAMNKSMSAMMQQAAQQQFEQMKHDHPELKNMTQEQQKKASEVLGRFMERSLAVATGDDMLQAMTEVYRHHLTRDDVDALIALYNAPAGQHMLAMAPAIMQEMMPSMMTKIQDKMKPIVADMEKEMAAIAPKPAAKSASKSATVKK